MACRLLPCFHLLGVASIPTELRNRKALSIELLKVNDEGCFAGSRKKGDAADGRECT